jgi:hypothetical protein
MTGTPGALSLRVLAASVGSRSPKNQGSRVIMSTRTDRALKIIERLYPDWRKIPGDLPLL